MPPVGDAPTMGGSSAAAASARSVAEDFQILPASIATALLSVTVFN
jgi:hypothetical protein